MKIPPKFRKFSLEFHTNLFHEIISPIAFLDVECALVHWIDANDSARQCKHLEQCNSLHRPISVIESDQELTDAPQIPRSRQQRIPVRLDTGRRTCSFAQRPDDLLDRLGNFAFASEVEGERLLVILGHVPFNEEFMVQLVSLNFPLRNFYKKRKKFAKKS